MLFFVLDTEESKKAERLYNKYSRFMYKVAYNILGHRQYTEDAIQQAFIRIINNLDKINENEEKRTRNFIGLITRNVAFDIYNSNKKQPVLLEESFADNTNGDISSIVIKKETVDRLKTHIKELKPIYQIPLIMKAQGMSTKDIALLLDINTKTVQKRIERARIMLYNTMREEES